MPYLNPAFDGHSTESAKIEEGRFDSTERLAQISMVEGGPIIAEAYVIYLDATGKSKKKSRGESKEDKKQKNQEARRLAKKNQKNGEMPEGGDDLDDARDSDDSHGSEINGMKQPVTIAADGRSVTAKIPAEVQGYRFMVIDSNRFLQYSELQLAK